MVPNRACSPTPSFTECADWPRRSTVRRTAGNCDIECPTIRLWHDFGTTLVRPSPCQSLAPGSDPSTNPERSFFARVLNVTAIAEGFAGLRIICKDWMCRADCLARNFGPDYVAPD